MRRGDIVLIVAPGDLGKPRPAVVVQSDGLGDNTTSVLLRPMSSEVVPSNALRPVVEPTDSTGIRVRSQIMTDKIVAASRQRIRRVIEHLDPADVEHVDRALLIVLGLEP